MAVSAVPIKPFPTFSFYDIPTTFYRPEGQDMKMDDHTGMVTDSEKSWAADQIMDIGHDTDMILKEMRNMGDSGFDSGMLAGLLGNRGIDPGIVALLNDRCRDGNWGDGGMLTLLLLVILLGGRNGFGYGAAAEGAGVAGVDRTVVNEANYSRLLDAIGTNGTRQEMAIQNLANALNCDVNAIQGALCSIDKQLAVNQGSIINAIQSCCCNLQGKIDQCCCQTNLRIERTENALQREIQANRFQAQTLDAATRQLIIQQFCDQNAYLASQFCDIKTREDKREIQALRDKVQEQREQANTQAILTAIENKTSTTTPAS